MSDSKHIVCPHCSTVNRVPEGKLTDKPNFALFHHGTELARQAGAMDTTRIVAWARSQAYVK